MKTTVKLDKTKSVIDIDRLHRVPDATTIVHIAPRRYGTTYYNFDSCLRIIELQDAPYIFFVTTNPEGNELARSDWYHQQFIMFLQRFSEYPFYESRGLVNVNGVNVIFTTFEGYKRRVDGLGDHYLIADV